MMNRSVFISATSVLIGTAIVQSAWCHGTPISVTASGGKLNVTGAVSGSGGYAPVIFVESNSNGDASPPLPLPVVGDSYVWQVPGFSISGLDVGSSLSIDVLSRPVMNASPLQSRVLWYWNASTQQVEQASAPFYLLGTNQRFTTLAPAASAAPGSFLLADPIGNGDKQSGGQQYPDNHTLLGYALDADNDPAAGDGAYGFFARLTSNSYAASDPFLVVLNFNVPYAQMLGAAQAINAAAFLPGDYTHDDRVNAADYVTWRKTSNTPDDYVRWRQNFGQIFLASPSVGLANIPEPSTGLLLVGGTLTALANRRGRIRMRGTHRHQC